MTRKVKISHTNIEEFLHERRNEPLRLEELDLLRKQPEPDRLRNNPEFKAHVKANLWAERRSDLRWSWNTSVFDFIEEVYRGWLGKGLLQSDIKALDPKLYAQLHKQLTAMEPAEKAARLEALGLGKESDARLLEIADPRERFRQEVLREVWREQRRAERARQRQRNHALE